MGTVVLTTMIVGLDYGALRGLHHNLRSACQTKRLLSALLLWQGQAWLTGSDWTEAHVQAACCQGFAQRV